MSTVNSGEAGFGRVQNKTAITLSEYTWILGGRANIATEQYSKIINKICHNEAGGATKNNVVGDECVAFVKISMHD